MALPGCASERRPWSGNGLPKQQAGTDGGGSCLPAQSQADPVSLRENPTEVPHPIPQVGGLLASRLLGLGF